MFASDASTLRTLLQWRQSGHGAALFTVLRTWGSSPRPPGSVMALRDDGQVAGSVSGGCIEDDLVHRCVRESGYRPQALPQRLRYGVDGDEARRFGLPCGGLIELAAEFDPEVGALSDLLAQLDASGGLVERQVNWSTGAVRLRPLTQPQALILTDTHFATTFGPAFRLILVGAGQIADTLCAPAVACGFAVTICDPREEYPSAEDPPRVVRSLEMPDDAIRRLRPDAHTAIVALSHDPKLDDLALLEALDSPAFFVGAIGSRRNQATRRERLRTHFGLSDAALARLRGPVGLDIGSRTPAEIAVSTLAEVLAVKNGIHRAP